MLVDFLCLIIELVGLAAGREDREGRGPGAWAWILLIVLMIASVLGVLMGLGLLFTGSFIVGLIVLIVSVIAAIGLGQLFVRARRG